MASGSACPLAMDNSVGSEGSESRGGVGRL